MFILDEPYVSDFLTSAVVRTGAPVLDTPMARMRLGDDSPQLTSSDEFARRAAEPGARLYANSENAIGWIAEHLAGTDIPRQIAVMKDKVAFRELVSGLHPDYIFREVAADELDGFDVASMPKPFVVKPAVGFFSIGVHVIDRDEQWPAAVTAIRGDIERAERLYPDSVLGLDRFVVEQVIEGEEFAVDAYFEADGTPVVLNVMAHLFASDDDVSDRVYYTSPSVVRKWLEPMAAYLAELGALAGLHDFPVHAEFRVDAAGRIAPIEVNPMRFGGWCVGDMSWFANGFDPYACYLTGARPDLDEVMTRRAGVATGIVVADFPTGIPRADIESVDYDGFLARFTRPLDLRRTDFTQYPVFAFLFVEVPEDDMGELEAVLHADLSRYLRMR